MSCSPSRSQQKLDFLSSRRKTSLAFAGSRCASRRNGSGETLSSFRYPTTALRCSRLARSRAHREREAAIAYEKRLDALALREDAAWQEVDALIEVRKPAEYDQAVRLLKDLQALGARNGCADPFDQRVQRLRERHVKKVSLLERHDRQGL
jgi:hypothetical protein